MAMNDTPTRKCGHPLGSTRWCPDCELAEMQAQRIAGPSSIQGFTDTAIVNKRVRVVIEWGAALEAWMEANGVHVEWIGGYWHAQQGKKTLTIGYPSPIDAVRRAMQGGDKL